MITLPSDNIILISEEYKLARKRKVGRTATFELNGVFGSASVQPGYLSFGGTQVFIAEGTPKTAPGRFEIRVPRSGYPMLKVTAATGTTSILVSVGDYKNV